MTDEEFNQYISSRYQERLEFYDKRAIQNKRGYRCFSIYIIAVSLILAPILSLDFGKWRLLTAMITSSIGIAAALLSHFKFQENWLRYRSTWDCLKRELSLHKAKVGPYKNIVDVNNLFIERVEAIFAKEGSEWISKQSYDEEIKTTKQVSSKVTERKY